MTPRKTSDSNKDSVGIVAQRALYKDDVEDKFSVVLETSGTQILNIATNPLLLIFGLYAVSVFGGTVGSMKNRFLVMIGVKKKSDVPDITITKVKAEDQPFEVYECQKCRMQMRPAKGR